MKAKQAYAQAIANAIWNSLLLKATLICTRIDDRNIISPPYWFFPHDQCSSR